MKTKTIKKILKAKIEDWVESVTDEKVKDAIKKDSIVTGGSIASMLLREKVNDYDIYFRTRESLEIVTEYYIELANKKKADVYLLNYDDREEEKEKFNQYSRALRMMESGQVKIFVGGDKGIALIDQPDDAKYQPVAITPNAISLTNDVQVVVRFYGEVKQIHKNYDFVHATNSYTYSNNELNLRKAALESLLTKELFYIGSKYPITSVIRSRKFINRGYTINAGTYLKMCWQISELDLKNIDVLEEQLVGVDIAYFEALITALRKVTGDKLTYSYIGKIIDKLFNE